MSDPCGIDDYFESDDYWVDDWDDDYFQDGDDYCYDDDYSVVSDDWGDDWDDDEFDEDCENPY